MKEKQLYPAVLLFTALSSLFTLAQADNRYCNERFGFCVRYPIDFKKEVEPANGDGQAFYDKRGFSMIVSGMNNVFEYDLDSLEKSQRKEFDKVTYQARGKNWIVLSGYKKDTILYEKFYLNPQTINYLYLRYPKAMNATYHITVSRIVKSFNPGLL